MEKRENIDLDAKEKKIPAFKREEDEEVVGFLDDPQGTTGTLPNLSSTEDDFDYEFDDVDSADDLPDYVSEDVADRLLEKETAAKKAEDKKKNSDETDNNDEGEKPSFFKKLKDGIKPMLKYFAVFCFFIILWELSLRIVVSHKIQLKNLWFIPFVPALAMVFTVPCGLVWSKKYKIVNKIIFSLLLCVACFYYVAQCIYFRNFGSLFSVALMGMGKEAVGNFGWAIKDTIIHSVGYLSMFIVPVIAMIVVVFVRKDTGNHYYLPLHGFSILSVPILWVIGMILLLLGGTGRHTAYYAFYNTMSDTDSTSRHIGAATTTIIEGASYYWGIQSSKDINNLEVIDNDALNLVPTAKEEPVVSGNSVSGNSASENVVVEEPFIPEPHINENIDFAALAEMATSDEIKSLCEYFDSKEPTYTNEYTGIMEDYNLIYICAESYSNLVLDPDVTPTLYKMANTGIVLNNFYNTFLNTTTNGEFAFQTSLYPDISRYAAQGTAVGSFAQSTEVFMPYGLGDFAATVDIPSYAYHNYYGHYYRRSYSWPNLGYENIKFMGEGMNFTYTWPASDLELMEQSIDDYIDQDQFIAYYMTFSGHGPYSSANKMYNKNVATVMELLGDRASDLTYDAIGYLACNYELELAMEYLLERLEEAGKLDNTLIVICGDHTPYYLSDAGKQSLAPYDIDLTYELYRSNVIMYTEGLEENIVTDTYCCNVDILPTVLNLMGIDYDSRLLMGIDIFSEGVHRSRIYTGSFLTELVKYNAGTGEAEWSDVASEFTEEQLDAYLNAMIDYTEAEYSASVKIIANNFYLYVWQNSGLLTDEEVSVELEREQAAVIRAEQELAAEIEAAKAEQAAAMEAMGLNPDGTPIEGWVPPETPDPNTVINDNTDQGDNTTTEN